ncbi:MAG: hypothetical protein AAF236_15575 [Verrucomicrobiota bacterium]
MERYKQELEGNTKVAFIHVSHDRSDDAAQTWAESEGFPWLTILPDDAERSGLFEYKTRNAVPHYLLVDAAGEMLANSSAAAFSKIAELTE